MTDAPEPAIDLDVLRQFFDEAIPFNHYLGLKLVTVERGRVVARLPFKPELVGDPARPARPGGGTSRPRSRSTSPTRYVASRCR